MLREELEGHSRPKVKAKLQREVQLGRKLAKVGRTKVRIRVMERINKRKMMKTRLKKVSTASMTSLMWKSPPQLRVVLRGSISKRGIRKSRRPLSNH